MGINGIGTAGYPVTGYTARKAERSAESGAVGFMETMAEKAAKDKATDYDEKAFDMVGPNAPQEVKDAWMDAAKEVNANGMGIRGNGMMSHISQMMVRRLNKQLKGETENFDILGSTVESAIQATIPEMPTKEIEELEDSFYQAKDTYMKLHRESGQVGKPLVLQNYIFGSGRMYEVLNRLGNLKERVE